jgi:CHAT domain-containing protein/Flp pilus assembly protein TadD
MKRPPTSWRLCRCVAIVLIALQLNSAVTPLRGEPPTAGVELSDAQQQRLKERDSFEVECLELRKLGKLAESLGPARKMLAIEKEVLGDWHDDVVRSLELIAQTCESLEDFDLAKDARQQILTIRQKVSGNTHWRSQDAERAVSNVDVLRRLSPAERQSLNQATALNAQVVQLHQKGEIREALPIAKQVLETRTTILGELHPETIASLNNLALLNDLLGHSQEAEAIFRKAVEAKRDVLGDQHPELATGLSNLGLLYQSRGDFAKAEPLLREAVEINREAFDENAVEFAICLSNLAGLYESTADHAKAEPLYLQALEIRRKVMGETHPSFAIGLNNLAVFYWSTGTYPKAEPLLKQALEINRVAYGDLSPVYASSLNNLAAFYKATADYTKAEPLYREAMEIRRKTLGEKSLDFARSLNNLAALYYAMGNYFEAEPLFRSSMEIKGGILGKNHLEYATSLNNLAVTCRTMGDFSSAEPLFREALEVCQKAVGEQHAEYANCLSNLGLLYESMGDTAKAEPLYRQSLGIRKTVLGSRHPDYAISLNNLAQICNLTGNSEEAEPLFLEALAINKETLGEKHPDYAISINNLAQLYNVKGDLAKAEALFRQALEIKRASLGESHPAYATGLNNLAMLYETQGDGQRAESLYRQALDIYRASLGDMHPQFAMELENLARIAETRGQYAVAEPLVLQSVVITRKNVELAATVQSERQQFSMIKDNRSSLNLYVSLAVLAKSNSNEVYQEVLLAKGSVWRRQQKIRAIQGDPQLISLFSDLQSVATQRAQEMLADPDPSHLIAWRQRIDQLAKRQEELELNLSMRSEAYGVAQEAVKVDELRVSLPVGHALVDFWEYSQLIPPPEGQRTPAQFERQIAAFILRPDDPHVTLISLGAVEPLREAIEHWRRSYGQSNESAQAAKLLRERLWAPVEERLAGVSVVLVSPDGVLGRFPLLALPGEKPGSYLLEERSIAIVPVPQAIVHLLNNKATDHPEVAGNLLVLGDVNYDDSKTTVEPSVPKKKFGRDLAAVRGSDWKGFSPLDATRGELATIDKLYRDSYGVAGITLLEKSDATEARFREEAPRHKYLHIATHGFFAPESLRSALSEATNQRSGSGVPAGGFVGYPPGLLSGLAMAGANQPVGRNQDDGILTAMEVEHLDLRGVQLVVLSACETGLGEVAGGEGLLGMQRAFQVAGAETVVASLWKVPDDATRSLMERFYKNLLGTKAKKGMPTLEALREAQLWMLKEGQVRGLVRIDANGQPQAPAEGTRTSPFYWAAFVVSGDWR